MPPTTICRLQPATPTPPSGKLISPSLLCFFGLSLRRILPRQPAPPSDKFDFQLAPGGRGLAGQIGKRQPLPYRTLVAARVC